MNLRRVLLLAALIVTLGSCGGPRTTTTTTPQNVGPEFKKLCQAVGATNNRITREQFIAAAKDKEVAAQLFDACDVERTGVLTEQEAEQNPKYFENLKNQVILFHTSR